MTSSTSEVVAPLGMGGMGEVYKARDTRIDRTVAIKVLRPELSADADKRARLHREARAIGRLNHPHICVLHDIGCRDGTDFLVMEFVEGDTLDQSLQRGPLPLDRVRRYAIEIADALDHAHRHGIVHRDLKPSNIVTVIFVQIVVTLWAVWWGVGKSPRPREA